MYRYPHDKLTDEGVLHRPPRVCARGSNPMGRGRAKAKQTKVARKLKYQTLDTDLTALQRELANDDDAGRVDIDDDAVPNGYDVDDDVEDDYDYSER